MSLLSDPDVKEDIDLSWVTFTDENPSVPCRFRDCADDATWMCITVPCGHEYPFCELHKKHTDGMLTLYRRMICTDCSSIVSELKYEPIKRG